jgi:iron(III) transport system permease protein
MPPLSALDGALDALSRQITGTGLALVGLGSGTALIYAYVPIARIAPGTA